MISESKKTKTTPKKFSRDGLIVTLEFDSEEDAKDAIDILEEFTEEGNSLRDIMDLAEDTPEREERPFVERMRVQHIPSGVS